MFLRPVKSRQISIYKFYFFFYVLYAKKKKLTLFCMNNSYILKSQREVAIYNWTFIFFLTTWKGTQ